ncbi:glycerophosphodiester phosphodiesterase [Rhodococcus sp. BP-252]|uniref:glycerophosphodiester phosphodiesterase family protein n=1 Tax=Nocardiaceae TaxID=85025 RepID=UPI0009FEC030|nr:MULTISPECIES: glycerophosphodiester phosphodiesterase family protein [Rhodococcus]MBY6414733.1 glycerophosphodiester phosphodiesterase [Rhodococcus sp. BP-320]MBY6419637.1 glycerophosphodiester phosphodiesterase [Rhodococcus sp. BP-321]MBY6424588.1 glycerophosphodiester phosphodiesterase [Rhodococcus sp. BP-324]MBY6429585.1 glycerophosphodiester phosphodiesterase [Rhodococcus sp. BP-323]MBY6434583.1 glycerophosphodiester phosphodiesterase [Rhodococcus sp. BP-322]
MRRTLLVALSAAALTAVSAAHAQALPIDAGSSNSGSSNTGSSEPAPAFDLQAHRGGLGLVSESTIAAFTNALELGVTTLELDTQITEDGVAVVTHDRRVSDKKCLDTVPVFDGDPEFPYVGKYVNTLTLAQVETLDCGSLRLADYPEQRTVPGARMPTLTEVLDVAKTSPNVRLNVETKFEAASPTETAPREQFVDIVITTIEQAGMLDRVSIQSFDWGALQLVRAMRPSVPLVALTNGDFLQVGQDGASPWLGGLDVDDFGGDGVAAAASIGASAYSPVQGNPQNGAVGDPGFELYVTRQMVDDAHARGMRVIPWTVDDPATMNALMDLGVDGIITDYPNRLRDVMAQRGIPLPAPQR